VDKYEANTGVIFVNAGLVEVGVIRTDEEQMIARSVCHVCGLLLEQEHDHEQGG
jgi:acetate kinase